MHGGPFVSFIWKLTVAFVFIYAMHVCIVFVPFERNITVVGWLQGDAWVSLALELFGWSKEVALAIVGVFEALHACYAPKDRVVESTYLKRFVLFLAVQVFALFPHGGTASAGNPDGFPVLSYRADADRIFTQIPRAKESSGRPQPTHT